MDHKGVESTSTPRTQRDVEFEIHNLEHDAYRAVLRAFKAQSDALTWDKEGLITELRKELRVSSDEHRELLMEVNSDDGIRRIKELREGVGRRSADGQLDIARSEHVQLTDHGSRGDPMALVGRSVMRRWPQDKKFYEAIITEYNHVTGCHALVYNINTPNATEEWVDMKEVHREDIMWMADDPITSRLGKVGRRIPSHNQIANKNQRGRIHDPDTIEIYNTNSLIRKVEKVLEASDPNESEVERAKKLLEEHEEKLVQAIARLNNIDREEDLSKQGDSTGNE